MAKTKTTPKKATSKAAAAKPSTPPKAAAKQPPNVTAKAPVGKGAARRIAPKRSASYGTAIEDFAAKLPEWQKQIMDELVALVRAAAPAATGMVKWGHPVFDVKGPFAFIKPATSHVTFGFWRGAELTDPQNILGGVGVRMRHLKIARGHAIPLSLLQRLVREAARLNVTHGDPTRRKA